jgi:hypothetical protein
MYNLPIMQVRAQSSRFLFRGKIDRLVIQFDELFWKSIQVTGGGRLEISELNLRLHGALIKRPIVNEPCQISADFTLTRSDILNSFFVRMVLQNMANALMTRILPNFRQVIGLTVQRCVYQSYCVGETNNLFALYRVHLKQGRLFVDGKAELVSSGTSVPFEISSALAARGNGHVLALPNPQLVLNPNTILHTQVPLAAGPVEVDLGEGFRLHSLHVEDKCVRVQLQTRVSPVDPFTVAPIGSSRNAQYVYDLGDFLSRILRNRMARWFRTQ